MYKAVLQLAVFRIETLSKNSCFCNNFLKFDFLIELLECDLFIFIFIYDLIFDNRIILCIFQ